MSFTISWWIIPVILSVFFIYKSYPKKEQYTDGNFSHIEIDNFLRLFWLIPLGFVWAFYFGIKYYIK